MTTFTVIRERAPQVFDVVKEDVEDDGESVVASYDFRWSLSAPEVTVGTTSTVYEDLFCRKVRV